MSVSISNKLFNLLHFQQKNFVSDMNDQSLITIYNNNMIIGLGFNSNGKSNF